MSFNPERQYRCTIIRGKAKSDMDDLLPAYAHILESICPCEADKFPTLFNQAMQRLLPAATAKTLNNHRTEMAGKLFGMYYTENDNVIQVSPRTQKLLRDSDQPAFFKDICYKLQFPNGMDKITKIRRDLSNHIHIKQCAYILKVLQEATARRVVLTAREAGYYVLNAIEVLQLNVTPIEAVETIIERRARRIQRMVPPGSRGTQHIRETFNYLELANLIKIQDGNLILNSREGASINFISSSWDRPLDFNMQNYDLNSLRGRKEMYLAWGEYYGRLATADAGVFRTTVAAISDDIEQLRREGFDVPEGVDTTALGDDGERYIYNREKQRVEAYNTRLVGRVLLLGRTRGLGFDIQSVRAERGANAEHAIYLEVKSTTRVTAPNQTDDSWSDVISLTRNEWIAAEQHRDAFRICRVYFTPSRVSVFVITDPITKSEQGILAIVPQSYRVDFKNRAGVFLNE